MVWLFLSIYVAGMILVVVVDAVLFETENADDAMFAAVLWPVWLGGMALLFFPGLPLRMLRWLHRRLRRWREEELR